MADLNLGRLVMEMVPIAARCGVRPSPDLTDFEIVGYPGLALILFLGAAAVGFTLVVNILITDRRGNRAR